MQWKMITSGVVLSLGCASPIAIGQVQALAEQHRTQAADAEQQAQLQLSRELPATPSDVTSALVDLIADGTPAAAGMACLMFSPIAAAQFAAANHRATCAQAIERLHSQVIDANTYVTDLTLPDDGSTAHLDQADVNECAVTWNGFYAETPGSADPGPRPGRMTMRRLDGHGWLITTYAPC
jgi:hypothetical protein